MTQGDPQELAGVREGAILGGKYRVEKVLGVGGMGVVVAAHHVQLDEKVAIKVLLPTMLRNADVVGRFAREARAAVKIKSEHVARVSDVGTLENGAPYMVMEFLEGGDLAAWVHSQGPLPIEQAVDFVLQACVGVASAHGIGIVHRDLKPANLFCLRGNDGQFVIKVLDFGISKITNFSASDAGGSMTHTTAVMGSPYYMSPEQMQSAKDVDSQTDIWALGVVLYELLSGATPFLGESFTEIAIKVATAPFASVRTYRPDVPPGLDAVIATCLEKDKKRRYANVAQLALALADFGSKRSRSYIERVVGIIQSSGLSTSALNLRSSLPDAPGPGVYGAPSTLTASAHTASGATAARHGPQKAALIVVAGGLLAIAAGTLWLMRPKSTASTEPPVTIASAPVASQSRPESPTALQPPKPAEPAPDPHAMPQIAASSAKTEQVVVPPTAESVATPGTRLRPRPGEAGAVPSRPAAAARVQTTAVQPATPAARAGSAAPAATTNCRLVSFFDADGNQHFKQQCGN